MASHDLQTREHLSVRRLAGNIKTIDLINTAHQRIDAMRLCTNSRHTCGHQ